MPEFPKAYSYLEFVEVIDKAHARYRCTFEENGEACGKLVTRSLTGARGAEREGRESACKVHARFLRKKRRPRPFAADRSKMTARRGE